MKINWLKTIGTTAAIGFIGVPVAITTVSCSNGSNQEPNNGKLPDQVLTTDTSKITSFAEAMKFTNEYLTKNYNFEMFKKDVKKYENKILESLNSSPLEPDFTLNNIFTITNVSSNKNKTINFKLELIKEFTYQSTNEKHILKITSECNNFEITPVLLHTNQNQLSLGFYIPWPTQPPFENKNMTGDDIVGTKNNIILNADGKSTNLGWIATQNPKIDNKKIYSISNNPSDINFSCFIPKTINLTFNNIQDIESNLYK